ncbi:unnamed protein product, partial [Mesorhabditis spiculigera]
MLCAALCALFLLADLAVAAPARSIDPATQETQDLLKLLNGTSDEEFDEYQRRLSEQINKTRDFFLKMGQQQRKSPGYADFVASSIIDSDADCPEFLRSLGEC